MQNNKPTLMDASTSENAVTLTLHVEPNTIYFSGHFAQFPILPGVTQIDWAMHYAAQYLSAPTQFLGMEVIKFQEPILPGATVTLALSWDASTQKLAFQYTSTREEQVVSHASGRLKLAASE